MCSPGCLATKKKVHVCTYSSMWSSSEFVRCYVNYYDILWHFMTLQMNYRWIIDELLMNYRWSIDELYMNYWWIIDEL